MQVSDKTEVIIDRLSLGGEGVARSDGRVVFVSGAVPGDRVEVEITEFKDRFAKARLIRVLEPSSARITPLCPYHPRPGLPFACGGCGWQQMAYESQLRIKTDLVKETLERLGGFQGIAVNPTLGMKDPWRYRNKVQQPVGWDPVQRRLISGFYASGSHTIVPIEDCLVQPELSVRILNRAKALLEKQGARTYDSQKRTGWIRHLLIRTAGEDVKKALLTFVTRTPDFPREAAIVPTLIKDFPVLVGIHQNVNQAHTNVILGRAWRRIAGQDHIEERLGRFRFLLSPASFFQINTRQTEVLYDVAKRFAGRNRRLLDLYTGVGTIAIWLADHFQEVGGVEENRKAVRDAQNNARLNGVHNVHFEAMPVEEFMDGLPHEAGGKELTVVLDPPRAGCTPGVLRALLGLRAKTVVYVSCDPGTLARDLKVLSQGGYHVTEVQPVDLFPQTPHIETVVKLEGGR